MIVKYEQKQGKRSVIMYKATHKGLEFCRTYSRNPMRTFSREK